MGKDLFWSQNVAVTKEKIINGRWAYRVDIYRRVIWKHLDISNVKALFQGGWRVQSVKHQDAQTFDNKADIIYLTCNELPELSEPKFEAPQWIEDNPIECLIWMINEINRNIKYVLQQERFYEKSFNEVTEKCKKIAIFQLKN